MLSCCCAHRSKQQRVWSISSCESDLFALFEYLPSTGKKIERTHSVLKKAPRATLPVVAEKACCVITGSCLVLLGKVTRQSDVQSTSHSVMSTALNWSVPVTDTDERAGQQPWHHYDNCTHSYRQQQIRTVKSGFVRKAGRSTYGRYGTRKNRHPCPLEKLTFRISQATDNGNCSLLRCREP